MTAERARVWTMRAVGAAAISAAAWAQSAPPPAPPPGAPKPAEAQPTKPTKPAEPPKAGAKPSDKKPAEDALPGLDELLGIPKDQRPEARPKDDVGPALPDDADPHKMELERALTDRQVSEMFQQAVQQMSDAADLLLVAGDAGLRTQRVQEEIIIKLDALIDQAEKQASQQQSSQQDQQDQEQQQQKVAAQPQPQQSQDNEQRQGDNRGERMPPSFHEGPLSDVLDSARAAWGSLPARIRDTLMQGTNDKFSSIYSGLTAEYYRRLAEQEQGGGKP